MDLLNHFTLGILNCIHYLSGTQHLSGQLAQHILSQVHQVIKICVGLVELEHGELGIMASGQTLVAEVAVDLIDPLEAANDQSLEVQLRGNTHIHIYIQRIVVGDKGTRHSAAGNHLQHGSFHFKKIRTVEVAANKVDNRGSGSKGIAHFRVNNQVNIALAIAHLLVGEAMEFIWQRTQGFGQQLVVIHLHIEVALARLVQLTGNTDDITQINGLGKRPRLFGDIELDSGRAVLNHHKGTAVADYPASDTDNLAQLLQSLFGLLTIALLQLRSTVLGAEVIGESGTFLLAKFAELGTALCNQLVFILLVSHILFVFFVVK